MFAFLSSNTLRPVQTRLLASRGYSLVELMVAMTVGLVIGFGALAVYSSTVTATRSVDNASRLQESGLYILHTLSKHIRLAGYVDWTGNAGTLESITDAINLSSFSLNDSALTDMLGAAIANNAFGLNYVGVQGLHGCTGNYATPAQLAGNNANACEAASAPAAQALTVAYQVLSVDSGGTGSASLPSAFSSSQGMSGDCLNQNTNGTFGSVGGAIAVNRFYRQATSNQLVCKGNGGFEQPIASNVEQLVFRYGIAQAEPTAYPSGFSASNYTPDMMVGNLLTATEVSSLGAQGAWPRVTQVEICVLIAGDAGSAPEGETGPTQFPDCLGTSINPTYITYGSERKLRRAFRTTVSLRNQIRATP